MLHMSTQINELKTFVEENNLERRSAKWIDTDDADIDDFPTLDEEDLRNITCGVYQIKLSTSYIQEFLDGDCTIQLFKEDQNRIRVHLQSRHVSSKSYLLQIKYTPAEVTSWYCKCRAGARVVGVCSHIAAILWYLGFARYQNRSSYGVKNWVVNVCDASIIPDIIGGSDTDEMKTNNNAA